MFCSSPGVTVTELQKRGGLDEEAYAKVCCLYVVVDLDEERPEASPLMRPSSQPPTLTTSRKITECLIRDYSVLCYHM